MFKNSLSFGAWNVGGTKKHASDPDFVQLLSKHDLIVLGETFADDDSAHFQGFKCINVYRKKKHKNAKRNSGGVSVLINREISKFVTVVRVTAEHLIWVKVDRSLTGYPSNLFVCCLYIPPNGSPYYENYPNLDLFKSLTHDIGDFSKLGHILLMGDFNARLGKKQDIPSQEKFDIFDTNNNVPPAIEAPPRNSMDSTSNVWGTKLLDLCNLCNLCTLNGRTLGDTSGRFTCFTGNGYSQIDLALVDQDMLSNIVSFSVHDLTEFSCHCLIETLIKCTPFSPQASPENLNSLKFTKYTWDPSTSPEKLVTALLSPNFKKLSSDVLTKSYPMSKEGTDDFTNDISNIAKFLHQRCAIPKPMGKKKSKFSKIKRQKWFNEDCQKLRQRTRRAANFFSRNPSNKARDDYVSAKRLFRKSVKKAQKAYKLECMNKLINSFGSQELWSALSDIRGKKSETPISMSDLESHFKNILNNSPKRISEEKLTSLQTSIDKFLFAPNCHEESFPPGDYSIDFLRKMIQSSKNGKSAFTDGILNEVIKNAFPNLAPLFQKFFKHIESTAIFPSCWKSSFLVPLHKKGSRGDPNNYRGLAVGSNLCKFYTKSLNERLKLFLLDRKTISQNQFGFQNNKRTNDAIFTLRAIVSHYKSRQKPLYAVFVDFSKAFDSINRTALAFKLGSVGIKGSMLRLFMNMYSSSEYIIKANGQYSYPISSTLGVKQGCSLSPQLFNIFVNDIHKIFDAPCMPPVINDRSISSLSFADDLVIFSESFNGLSESVKRLENYCNSWGLKVNADKTKILVFNKAFSKSVKNLTCSIDGQPITSVKSYTYLGVDVSNTGNFSQACDTLYKKSLRALFSLYSTLDVRANTPLANLYLKLFDSLIKPILLYGCDIWGMQIAQPNNVINKFVNKFYRTLLGVPSRTSIAGVHIELGRLPITSDIYISMIKYWLRLISLEKDTLVSHCYWALFEDPLLSDPWLRTIRNIVYSTGFQQLWDNQAALSRTEPKTLNVFKKSMIEHIKNQFIQSLTSNMQNESRLHFFKNSKDLFVASDYLSKIDSFDSRSLMSKLRLGVLNLEMEIGRWRGWPHPKRTCEICKNMQIEDEIHFLFQCPAYNIPRLAFITHLERKFPTFRNLSNQEKLKQLYFSEDTPDGLLFTASYFLTQIWNLRESLL